LWKILFKKKDTKKTALTQEEDGAKIFERRLIIEILC